MPTPLIFINMHFSLILANVNTHLTKPTVFHTNVALSIASVRLTSINILRPVRTCPTRDCE